MSRMRKMASVAALAAALFGSAACGSLVEPELRYERNVDTPAGEQQSDFPQRGMTKKLDGSDRLTE